MSIQLNPKDVLAHLNSMGYRNITAEQLKEFMKDLKRLIKYESKYSLQSPNATSAESPLPLNKHKATDHFEKLYQASTEATKARLNARCKKADKENDNPYDPDRFDRKIVGETIGNCPRQQSSGNRMQNEHKRITKHLSSPSKHCFSNENAVKRSQPSRSSSAPPSTVYFIRNTPTDLYQNYLKEWIRFKHLLPGVHPRSNERQIIRKRMEIIQKPQPKPKVYVQVNDDNTKVIRRMPKDFH